jgi:DNA polymerase I
VVDVQALAGDSVDNIPGAPGIGVKTAALLINEYGDLETLLARADEIKQPKRRETLIDYAEQIRISRRLVNWTDVPLDVTLDDLEVRDPDPEALMGFLAQMEFRTLSRRIAEKLGVEPPVIPKPPPAPRPGRGAAGRGARGAADRPCAYETSATWRCCSVDRRIRERGYVAFDTETTGLDEMRADLVGISLALSPGGRCLHAARPPAGRGDLFGRTRWPRGRWAGRGARRAEADAGGSRDPEDRAEHEIRRQDPGPPRHRRSRPSTTRC